jgi:hypothetical protein
MKALGELSLQEYNKLKQTGMFWELYPEATGCVDDDLECVVWATHTIDSAGNVSFQQFYDIRDEEAHNEWQ